MENDDKQVFLLKMSFKHNPHNLFNLYKLMNGLFTIDFTLTMSFKSMNKTGTGNYLILTTYVLLLFLVVATCEGLTFLHC